MDFESIQLRYLDNLLQGNRLECRAILGEALQTGTPANTIYTELFWPIMTEISRLYREHQINQATEQMATRINRTLVDQFRIFDESFAEWPHLVCYSVKANSNIGIGNNLYCICWYSNYNTNYCIYINKFAC